MVPTPTTSAPSLLLTPPQSSSSHSDALCLLALVHMLGATAACNACNSCNIWQSHVLARDSVS